MNTKSLNNNQSIPLIKNTRLHWYHWLVLVASLNLTVGAWYYSKTLHFEKIKANFNREAEQTIELVSERMQKYEDVLWSGVGLFNASESVTLDEWKSFSQTISIEKQYPGINGMGFISYLQKQQVPEFLKRQRQQRPNFSIHPKHDKDILMPITYIEPVEGNAQAVGLDMSHELNRYHAAIQAKTTRQPVITAPITLVQDSAKTPGFLFFVPVYDGKGRLFKGFVYAPFIVKKLMKGTLSRNDRHVAISINDTGNNIYNEYDQTDLYFDPNPLFKMQRTIKLYGRNWSFDISSDMQFREAVKSYQSMTILFSGLVIDALLLILFVLMTRSNKYALRYAEKATQSLVEKTDKLEKSNKELQQFAYITSHDLKAPLRGIDHLVGWIEEDAAEQLDPKNQEYLKVIRSRITRMNNLIQGILAYSKVSNYQHKREEIHTQKILNEVREEQKINKNVQIDLSQAMPMVKGSNLQFKQVVDNLISNAIKYNDKKDIEIEVDCRESDSHYEFMISDNGPGVDEVFHEKIFEIFQTLQPKDKIESTGIGLTIVKKIVNEAGGSVWLESKMNKGTRFYFTWPKN